MHRPSRYDWNNIENGVKQHVQSISFSETGPGKMPKDQTQTKVATSRNGQNDTFLKPFPHNPDF